MAFQILDKDGNGITLHDLDREACAFWGIDVLDKIYARPDNNISASNWFDAIGFNISCLKRAGEVSWNLVVAELFDTFDSRLETITDPDWDPEGDYSYSVNKTTNYLKGHLELIHHWRMKGYKAVCII